MPQTSDPKINTPASNPVKTSDITQSITDLLNKLPPLPQNWLQLFVKWYPWLLIITSILALPFVLAALGLSSAATLFSFGTFWAFAPRGTGLGLVISIVNTVISLVAGLQMLGMKKLGWQLAMVGSVLGILQALTSYGSLSIIISLLAIYFLWQVKNRYN